MEKVSCILACVDLSEYSLMVMEYAVELATALNAQIVVCNVINQRDISTVEKVAGQFPDAINFQNYTQNLKNERLSMVKQLIRENFFEKKTTMRIVIETGVPFECILRLIEKEKVDLVVIANKGRSNVSRVLFGSAAEKIFRHSPVPVLSVRSREKFHYAS